MTRGSVALALALTVAACTNDPPPPRTDTAVADAAPGPRDAADAAQTPDGAAADVTVERDAAADGGMPVVVVPDAAAPPSERPLADAAAPDSAPDRAPPDTAAAEAGPPDAGATCGAGVPRDMLCTTYCQGIGAVCTGANSQYASAGACLTACNAPTSPWACGAEADRTGNSLFCRLGHLVLAGVGSAAAECPSAGPRSPACK
jgi:hypothetical protein